MQTGATPLYIASQQGQLEVVKALIERRADVNAKRDVSSTRGHPPARARTESGLRAESGPARARLLMRIAAYSCARDMNNYMMCCMHTISCVAVYWFDHYDETV